MNLIDDTMLLSIIIPLYNCREYINRCILSVYSQGLDEHDFEVIVINDGSTDGGERLVEELAKKHSNLVLFNQENQGLSAVRNRGIEESRGKYIEFLDADDYLTPGNMERLLKIATDNDLDILVFKTRVVEDTIGTSTELQEESSPKDFKMSPVITGVDAELLKTVPEYVLSVNYLLMRRQLYMDLNLRFDTDISYGEDAIVSMQLFYNSKRVIVTECDAHRYVNRSSSLCHDRNKKVQTKRVRCYRMSAIQFNTINEAYKARSSQGYELQRQRVNLFAYFYLYGTFTSDIPTSELREGIGEFRENGIYPIGGFERFGYTGIKNKILRTFCNCGWLFIMAHRIYKLER